MSDLLAQGSTFLATAKRQYVSSRMIYRRGGSSVSLPAERARFDAMVDDQQQGIFTEYDLQDWLIGASDLRIDNIVGEPKAGDQIVDGDYIWEVMQHPQVPPWRWSDGYRNRFRIHTKLVTKPASP